MQRPKKSDNNNYHAVINVIYLTMCGKNKRKRLSSQEKAPTVTFAKPLRPLRFNKLIPRFSWQLLVSLCSVIYHRSDNDGSLCHI